MNRNAHLSALAASCAAALVTAPQAHAGAFYLQEQSARAVGRAFSGEAADSGPQSLWWNPASIAGQKGCEAGFSATAILPKGTVRNVGTTVTRPTGATPPTVTSAVGGQQSVSNPIVDGFLPAGAAACGVTSRLALGVALSSPFSFTTQYPSTGWQRYSGIRSHLRTIDIQPTVAFQPIDGLGIGIGLNIEQVNAELTKALPQASPSPLLSDGLQSLTGSGWDLGWSVGLRYARGPVELGASYKSAVKHELDGRVVQSGLIAPLNVANLNTNAIATFTTPWQAIAGLRYHATPALTLNLQGTRFGWSEFDAIRLGAPLNSAIVQNYVDTWAFAGGIEFQVDPTTTLRAGLMYDESPVKDGNRDARVPDTDRWTVAAGLSHDFTRAITVDLGFGYTMFKDGPVDRADTPYGALFPATVNTNGRVEGAKAYLLSLGVRSRF